jgi:Tol biopolymer transport system component
MALTKRCGLTCALLALSAAICLTLAVGPDSAPAAFPGTNGKIAFASDRDGNRGEIYVMEADGTAQTRLTNNLAADVEPAFSPDGRTIAFTSDRDTAPAEEEIYVMKADGTGQTRLTHNDDEDRWPAFSPDGSKIAFTGYRAAGSRYEIHVMNADGTGEVNLSNNPAGADDFAPAFSPDGTRIAFASNRDDNSGGYFGPNHEIYVMNADGSNVTRLTNDDIPDGEPTFSPDGSKIAYTSVPAADYEVHIMNADGSGQTKLTGDAAADFGPAFSPEGTEIAFHSDRDGDFDVYTMNLDGSGLAPVTDNTTGDSYPDWGPRPASPPPCEEDTSGAQELGPISGLVHALDAGLGSGSGNPVGRLLHHVNCDLIVTLGL